MAKGVRRELLDTTRGRIVSLLRARALTAEDIAAELGLTRSAIRLHLAAMHRDGVVRKVGKRAGATRPSHLYELTADVEALLSKAYLPLLTHLVDVFAEALPEDQLQTLLRVTGKQLGGELRRRSRLSRGLHSRVAAASALMNEHLGALTHVERNGQITIRAVGCPLAALTGKHVGVCLAMASMVAELVGVAVRQCCERDGRPRCCFEIGAC